MPSSQNPTSRLALGASTAALVALTSLGTAVLVSQGTSTVRPPVIIAPQPSTPSATASAPVVVSRPAGSPVTAPVTRPQSPALAPAPDAVPNGAPLPAVDVSLPDAPTATLPPPPATPPSITPSPSPPPTVAPDRPGKGKGLVKAVSRHVNPGNHFGWLKQDS